MHTLKKTHVDIPAQFAVTTVLVMYLVINKLTITFNKMITSVKSD